MESGPRMFKKQHGGKNKNIAQIENLTPKIRGWLMRSEFIQVQIINRESLLGLHLPISVQNIKALWGCEIPSRPKEGRLTWQQHVSLWGTLTFKGLCLESSLPQPSEPQPCAVPYTLWPENASCHNWAFLISKRIETRLPSKDPGAV